MNRRKVFHDLTAGRLVVQALIREQQINSVRTLAYVVMPDHLHWLCQVPGGIALSLAVNNVKSLSARRINGTKKTQGPLWQKGFHDRAVRRSDDVQAIARYIIANPLRAGMVDDVRAYALWDAVWVGGGIDLV